SLPVEQLDHWIDQRILNAGASEGRADRTEEDRRWIGARDDYAANHDTVIQTHEPACADVHEPFTRLLQVVYFREAKATHVVPARHDRGVAAGVERGQNGRFTIAAGPEPGLADFLLLDFFPIVVAEKEVSAGVVQLEGRMDGHAGEPESGQ